MQYDSQDIFKQTVNYNQLYIVSLEVFFKSRCIGCSYSILCHFCHSNR